MDLNHGLLNVCADAHGKVLQVLVDDEGRAPINLLVVRPTLGDEQQAA